MANDCCDDCTPSCCDNISDNKMCRMTQPPNKFDLKKVIELTSDPKFICKCCGRTANNKDNLCNPAPL